MNFSGLIALAIVVTWGAMCWLTVGHAAPHATAPTIAVAAQ